MSPLLWISLFFQLGATPPAAAGTSAISIKTYRDELALLHHAVDRGALRSILVFDPANTPAPALPPRDVFATSENASPPCGRAGKALREARPGEMVDDSTPVMILHLWASWCEPCKEDLTLWRELGPRLIKQHKGRVRVVHLALEADGEAFQHLAKSLGEQLPSGRIYFDCQEKLSKDMGQTLGRLPPLPMTLWLDGDRIVRQAMVGPMNHRRNEAIDSTARLLALIEKQENAALSRSQRPPE